MKLAVPRVTAVPGDLHSCTGRKWSARVGRTWE